MTTTRAALPRWLRPANRLIRLLTRLGLPLGTIHVLTVPGRLSGVPRPTPVSPLTVDGRRYVIAGVPEGDWARNVRAAGRGELACGRRKEAVTLEEVTDPGVRTDVMRAFPREVPHGVPMFVRLGLVSGPDPDEFAAAAGRVAVFRLRAS
ncbi:nitroreductase/quinone reductase family protein [Amycolatopsis sp. NEAU-NG30]|uniref:Nitroreductase/quinone reductase family protein n=1 Tax=Amycolatopsis melonis TaxID=3156488 RepID=A0ABV0LTY8_9PSEU